MSKFNKTYFTGWYDKCGDDRNDNLKSYLELALEGKKDVEKILDVGCAYGQFLHLCEARGCRTVGIDISEFALKKARKNCRAKLICLNVSTTHWPVDDYTFDLVTSFDLLEHLDSCELFFSEAFRVLRPGGRLFYTTPNDDSWLGKMLSRVIADDPTHLNKHGSDYWLAKTTGAGFKDAVASGIFLHGFPPGSKLRNLFRKYHAPVLMIPVLTNFLPMTTTLIVRAKK